ncbi:MAG TPA: DciA family protein [Actinomycetales bacterium]|nr:DciA family protein [Actinomycetales bacterium]
MSGERPDDRPVDPLESLEPGDAEDERERAASAARTALQRARAAAAARGLRPGHRGRSRSATSPDPSRTAAGDREPQALGAGLERLVTDRGWQVDVAVGGVMGRWPRVVGPDVAAHCTPVSFADGVLTVRADSTAWATQVRLLVPTLLRRLAEELGDDVVRQVHVGGPASPSWRRGRRAVQGPGPRDTYG